MSKLADMGLGDVLLRAFCMRQSYTVLRDTPRKAAIVPVTHVDKDDEGSDQSAHLAAVFESQGAASLLLSAEDTASTESSHGGTQKLLEHKGVYLVRSLGCDAFNILQFSGATSASAADVCSDF